MKSLIDIVSSFCETMRGWNAHAVDIYGICRSCVKFKTDDCPNAKECFDTLDKPYYQEFR